MVAVARPQQNNVPPIWKLIAIIMAAVLMLGLQLTSNFVDYLMTDKSQLDMLLTTDVEKKDIIIVGAGAAGLTASRKFFKKRKYFNVKLLEASDTFGGRIRKTNSFADFSIDLGAAFISNPHGLRDIAQRLVESQTVKVPGDGSNTESMFRDMTWYDFFAEHLYPSHIVYECQVEEIEYRATEISVSCGDKTFMADHVIVTVPISVLKDGDIQFDPPLPKGLSEEHPAQMQAGLSVVMEFKKTLYPPFFTLEDEKGEKSRFWDISSVKESQHHILTGNFIGQAALKYTDWSEDDIMSDILKLLNSKYPGTSADFIKHQLVNWSKEAFIRGAIASSVPSNQRMDYQGPQSIGGNKILLAGEAFPGGNQEAGLVHSAALSGREAAERIIDITEQQNQLDRIDH